MPLKKLLAMMLPGLVPLLVYVGASELWGDLVGLWVGVGLGATEFLVLLAVARRPDWFVLGDTALLVALGLISIGLDDAVFFRLKPVFVEGLLVAVLAWSAFGPRNWLLGSVLRGAEGERFRAALEAQPAADRRLRGQLKLLTVVLAAHTGLALVSALWMSREAWAFITGVLPYLLVVPVAAVPFFRRRSR